MGGDFVSWEVGWRAKSFDYKGGDSSDDYEQRWVTLTWDEQKKKEDKLDVQK